MIANNQNTGSHVKMERTRKVRVEKAIKFTIVVCLFFVITINIAMAFVLLISPRLNLWVSSFYRLERYRSDHDNQLSNFLMVN